jgi:hypothetical protein
MRAVGGGDGEIVEGGNSDEPGGSSAMGAAGAIASGRAPDPLGAAPGRPSGWPQGMAQIQAWSCRSGAGGRRSSSRGVGDDSQDCWQQDIRQVPPPQQQDRRAVFGAGRPSIVLPEATGMKASQDRVKITPTSRRSAQRSGARPGRGTPADGEMGLASALSSISVPRWDRSAQPARAGSVGRGRRRAEPTSCHSSPARSSPWRGNPNPEGHPHLTGRSSCVPRRATQ